jgi:hypothetical protein
MNSYPHATAPASPVHRRRWPWIVAALVAPFAILAVCLASYVTLDRDAAVLRRHVMTATGADWSTKVQVSLGRFSLGAAGAGLRFVDQPDIDDAREALRALESASVGVYELASGGADWSPAKILADTDAAMSRRGWSRLVGVAGREETVMIYAPNDLKPGKPIDLALAVVSGRELVVACATIDLDSAEKLVARLGRQKTDFHLGHFARR